MVALYRHFHVAFFITILIFVLQLVAVVVVVGPCLASFDWDDERESIRQAQVRSPELACNQCNCLMPVCFCSTNQCTNNTTAPLDPHWKCVQCDQCNETTRRKLRYVQCSYCSKC